MAGTLPHAANGRPAAETVARLDRSATTPTRYRYLYLTARGGWPPGRRWLALDRLAGSPELDAWYRTELAGSARGHRDVAGSLVAYGIAEVLADLVVATLVLQGRVLTPSPSRLWLRLSAGTAAPGIEAAAVASPGVTVLPDDPHAGRPGTATAPDRPSLLAAAAGALVSLFGPVTQAVRARAPYGVRGMWGTLADHVAEVALRAARPPTPGAQQAAWTTADALIDRVAAEEPLLRGRPRPQWVTCRAGTALYVAKGTCCLIYKAHPGPDRPGPRALIDARACATCPLRTTDDRRRRLETLLERSPAAAAL